MNALAEIQAVPEQLCNLEAEQGVLGTLLLNNGALDTLPFLKPDHFSEPVHQVIFSALSERRRAGQPATVITIRGDLPAFQVAAMGPAAYLAHLAGATWTTGEAIAGTARELVALSAKRRLTSLGGDLARAAGAPGMKASELIGTIETELLQLSEEIGQLNQGPDVDGPAILADITKRMKSGRHYKGAECGLVAIDNRLGGFAPGELIVVAGRPGMGKTALGLSLARRAAHIGVGVGFDTLEMTKPMLWHRLLSDECFGSESIPYKNIGKGRVTIDQLDLITRASEILEMLPLVVIDRGNRLEDLPAHVRTARRELARKGHDLELFVVDYLGLLRPSDRYAGQKVNEVGEISSTLKALAKREGIAIIALHQLSRANENRSEDHRPRLSDLRDSGNLEQDADVVMFVYRDAYYIERPGYRSFASPMEQADALAKVAHLMEVVIAKQRQGEVATDSLWCDMALNAVRDLAQ